MTVRAKFMCVSREQVHTHADHEQINYRFVPQYQPEVPEDQRYAKYTPTGGLELSVTNPAVNFEVGRQYHVDITPVED